MIAEMHGKGIPVELIVSAVATFEEAMAARAVSTGIPVDTSTIDKRRAWDRERKRRQKAAKSPGGIPPESTGIPAERRSILSSEEGGLSKVEVKKKKEGKKDARGTRVPPDFSINDEDRAFAASLGIPPETVEAETPQFIDYWSSIPGARGLKTNWKATWRNRMRDLKKYQPTSNVRTISRPLTEFQKGRQELKGILNDLGNYASGGSQSGGEDTRLLSGDPGERPQGLRSGTGGDVIDLPAGGYRTGG